MLCSFSAAIAVVAVNRGLRQRKFRSASIDSGIEGQLRLIKNETFKKLAKKDIEEKLLQSKFYNILQILFIIQYVESCNSILIKCIVRHSRTLHLTKYHGPL